MKRNVPIEKTFDVIRALPPDIDFMAIQQFVIAHPVIPLKPDFNWINLKNFFPMIAITSVLTVTLLFFRPEQKEQAPVSEASPENIPAIVEESKIIIADSPRKEIVKTDAVKKKSSVNVSSSTSSSSSSVSASIDSSQSASVSASGSSSHSANAFASACGDSASVNVVVNEGYEAVNEDRIRIASTKCNCHFGDDNEWIENVVKELLKEKLIETECEYKFKLTPNSFFISGKEIENKQFASKMMDLFEGSTGERLKNEGDYVQVKVTDGSCSLSKNINN